MCTVWKVFCFCAQYTFLMYRLESVVFICSVHISDVTLESVLFLCTVHIFDIPSGKCSNCVHSIYFCCAIRKVFCSLTQNTFRIHRFESVLVLCTFLMYLLECVLFVCTVYFSDVPSRKCSVSVHSTQFRCAVWKVFCFSAQYIFLM
jgi:hypothetical protein